MQSETRSVVPSEHYLRSSGGLWVRARRLEEAIRVEVQTRVEIVGGRVHTLDANGDVVGDASVQEHEWGDPWSCAGEIPIDDALVEFCGVAALDACCYGLMRHVVGTIVLGYGESPEEVAGWFRDFVSMEWVHEGMYRIDREHDPLIGLVGTRGEIVFGYDPDVDAPVLNLRVGTTDHAIPLDTAALAVAFACSAIPD